LAVTRGANGTNAATHSNGTDVLPAFDQRGFLRRRDSADADTTATVDIGAFEAQASVEDIPDKSTAEDTLLSFSFNVGDANAITSVTASSGNPTLVPNLPSNIGVTGSGSTRTLNITPAADQNGNATITVTVNSGAESMQDTFVLTVTEVNDPPTAVNDTVGNVTEDSGTYSIPIATLLANDSRGPANESGQTITLNGVSNPVGGTVVINGANIDFSPTANFNGAAGFDYTIQDNGTTGGNPDPKMATGHVSFNITAVNDAPSFTKGQDQTVIQNAGAQTVNNWATNISVGPANEAGQTLAFIVTNNNNALFASQPAISPTGTLTFTPAVNATGSAVVSAKLMDNGGTANGGVDTSAAQTFNITVSNGGTIQFSAATYSVAENVASGNATITITRTGGSSGTATVQFATSNGTATAPSDYTVVSTTVNFADGDTSKTVNVPIINDALNEPDETVNLTLNSVTGAAVLGAPSTAVLTITNDDAAGGIISFSQPNYSVNENAGFLTITVNRTGDTTGAAAVDYATSDDSNNNVPCVPTPGNSLASSRCDFTTAIGTLKFAAGETSKTFVVLVDQDSYIEGPEAFPVALSNPIGGAVLAAPSTATVTINDVQPAAPGNVVDVTDIFVRQHYHDFLNREADPSGLQFWTDQITSCGNNAQCIEVKRINVSAAFYLSIEFQETGYLVYRLYKVAYGDATGTSNNGGTAHQLSVPVIRLLEFLPDSQQIRQGIVVGQSGWQQALENNKQAFTAEFVKRSRFTNGFPTSLTPGQCVNMLFDNAGLPRSGSDYTAAINDFAGAANTADLAARAKALRRVAENASLAQQEFNRAFVLMQYYGYLRRNPNNLPDSDYSGYDFWLTKLNSFNGNFIQAEMVKAFITSSEYRQRFGP